MAMFDSLVPKYFKDFEEDKRELVEIISFLMQDVTNILLTGNECCGKTTLLNVIVKEFLKKNKGCSESSSILRLKDNGVQFCRNELKFFCKNRNEKMVIVDDIDTLSLSSQNILKNCISKYNKTTNFIFSCTNTKNVLHSIQSSLFVLKIPNVTSSLKINIIKKIDDLKISEESKAFIVNISPNIKCMFYYLQKCILSGISEIHDVKDVVCIINPDVFDTFTIYIKKRDLKSASELLLNLYDNGFSNIDIFDAFFSYIKMTFF